MILDTASVANPGDGLADKICHENGWNKMLLSPREVVEELLPVDPGPPQRVLLGPVAAREPVKANLNRIP